MPNPAMDSLTKESNHQQIQEAVSSEIEMCMKEPAPPGAEDKQKYCAGKAYGMARSKTGQALNYGK
jgi:hypothetical protein